MAQLNSVLADIVRTLNTRPLDGSLDAGDAHLLISALHLEGSYPHDRLLSQVECDVMVHHGGAGCVHRGRVCSGSGSDWAFHPHFKL